MSTIVRRRRARRNPSSSVASAIGTDAIFGLVGAGIGAATHTPASAGAIAGANGGLVLASLGGLVVAAISKPLREQGLVMAGVGLGGLLILNVVDNMIGATAPS